jgi:hypothetical protein
MTNREAGYRSSLRALLLAAALVSAGSARADDAQARAVLKSMSDYIGALGAIETTVDTSLEVVTPEMEKIAFTSTSTLRLNRPGQVRLERKGGFADVEFLFDGKMMTIRDRGDNLYAQVPATGTVNDLVVGFEEQFGLAVPGADLLLTNSYDVLIAGVLEAKMIGQGVVGGHLCDHVAFRNFDTDWQLWVRQGPEKIPCKMIITSKTVGMAPQYTTHVRSWTSNPKFAPGAFAFKPAAGERKVEVGALSGIDEVPPPSAPGGSK